MKVLRSAVRPVVTLLLVIAIIALAFLWTLGIAPNDVPSSLLFLLDLPSGAAAGPNIPSPFSLFDVPHRNGVQFC